LNNAAEFLRDSKISGPFGNYGSIDPRVEKRALKILGFVPFYGATQIMPREAYAPLGQALAQVVFSLDKFATTLRLGARSGNQIFQEPFGKNQVGSSSMPQKKNTIRLEQEEGLARLALAYSMNSMMNIVTWENRSIEQSSDERVIWPDLFHATLRSFKNMEYVLGDLQVFADHMLREIIESRGCYAASEAKEILKTLGLPFGLTSGEAYRMVQLAAFNVFEPSRQERYVRENLPRSLEEADKILEEFAKIPREKPVSIQQIILEGKLKVSPELEATDETVLKWNRILKKIFEDSENIKTWNEIFLPSFLLKNEAVLFEQVL
jgi:adenylosuccinate lyase